ncbi:hypothetical protein INR49_029448, partial [Caranx melampygus]
MSDRSNGVEWIETTEEVVVTEECLASDSNTQTVISVLEPAETPNQKDLDTEGDGETPEADDGFYCEECLTLFQDQSDPASIGGPSFVLDFPTSMGVPQRALLTLPYGLMIGRSSIPRAGIGVINHGPIVSPGMHFGPFEGEVTTSENAMSSAFTWEICKGEQEYEYIDGARETHSNWMRYVNCARNKDETNLLAVQYKGSILFHCCRTIQPGDELMVWPSSKLLNQFSEAWTQMWFMRLNSAESNAAAVSEVFLCSHCQLTFTTESFLQRHTEHFHSQPAGDLTTPATEMAEPENPTSTADSEDPAVTNEAPDINASENLQEAMDVTQTENMPAGEAETSQFSCSDCGKSFTNEASLRKHKVIVHERLRPYVCTVCQKCFGQYNDLTRHLRRHQKEDKREQGEIEAPDEANTMPFSCAECSRTFSSVDTLQEHISEQHSEDTAVDNQDGDPEAADDDQSHDPDFIPQTSEAKAVESIQRLPSQRPQRLGARSRISAITKLIAPKRRADICKKPSASTAQTEQSRAEPEAPAAKNGKLTKYKWFSCNRCKRTYANPDDLKAHKCTLRQHKCGQCGATFNMSGFLRRHEQTVHANAKSYSCDRCDKVFTTSGNLKQHQKSNTCLKYHCTSELFPCSFCQFSFTMKSYLIKHIKRHHPAFGFAVLALQGLILGLRLLQVLVDGLAQALSLHPVALQLLHALLVLVQGLFQLSFIHTPALLLLLRVVQLETQRCSIISLCQRSCSSVCWMSWATSLCSPGFSRPITNLCVEIHPSSLHIISHKPLNPNHTPGLYLI